MALRGEKFKEAKVALAQFHDMIGEKRMDWKIAQSFAKASKLANAGADFQSQLMQDTAVTTIQDGLNAAFADLDSALLDEQPAQVSAPTMASRKPATAIADNAPPDLGALFSQPIEAEVVSAPARSRARR